MHRWWVLECRHILDPMAEWWRITKASRAWKQLRGNLKLVCYSYYTLTNWMFSSRPKIDRAFGRTVELRTRTLWSIWKGKLNVSGNGHLKTISLDAWQRESFILAHATNTFLLKSIYHYLSRLETKLSQFFSALARRPREQILCKFDDVLRKSFVKKKSNQKYEGK